ncbi:alkaline phosphatase family protein [bacterium]|nr:alkaline phosphatase family protein [bacterium]
MKPLLVLDVVGLTREMLGDGAPNLSALACEGFAAPIDPVLPAVTCPVQSTYLTGLAPSAHGIVANGWFDRDLQEVLFWKQSNRLVLGEDAWEAGKARDPAFTCAQLFWWFNMGCGADWAVTPRPAYPADGRKVPDCYARPAELRLELNVRLGRFPLFQFWGPLASIESTRWIADAAIFVLEKHRPTLTLVYLPHLDYDLQRFGPADPRAKDALRAVDAEVGRVVAKAREQGAGVIALSEYGIEPVSQDVALNRALREAGFLEVQRVLDSWEVLDPIASRAFAVCDHQVAHVYVREPSLVPRVREVLEKLSGVERVLDAEGKKKAGLDHARSGELVAIAAPGHWFSYYYWLDESRKPDFAATVDIFRKPGYDPAELFFSPGFATKARVGWRLAQKALGFRSVLDVVPTDGSLVRGSHGREPRSPERGAVFVSSSKEGACERVSPLEIKERMLRAVFSGA